MRYERSGEQDGCGQNLEIIQNISKYETIIKATKIQAVLIMYGF